MSDEIRNCIICGKEYKPYKICQKTCGGKERIHELDRQRRDERNFREKMNRALAREKKKHTMTNVEEACAISNKAYKEERLSYGQYVAKYNL